LSAWRKGKSQAGFSLDRNLFERSRFIYPTARRLLGVGSVELPVMKLPSIFPPSIRWMSWRNWECAKRQANARHCSIHTQRKDHIFHLIITADSVFTKSVEKIVRIVLMGRQ
jgi:hypothetical protein